MKRLTKFLLFFVLLFDFFSCYPNNFIIDKTNNIDKLSCEEINGPLDTLSRFYHIDVYVIAIDSCMDTMNFFNEYKQIQNNRSLIFVFPLKVGFPFSMNTHCLSDFDYSMLMNIQHRLFPCYSNSEIEEEYPSSIRLRSFARIICDYLYEVRNNTSMHHRSDDEKRLYVMSAINKYDYVPKMEMKYYNRSNWREDENEKKQRRINKNVKELGDLFKAIFLIAGIAIFIYHRIREK